MACGTNYGTAFIEDVVLVGAGGLDGERMGRAQR